MAHMIDHPLPALVFGCEENDLRRLSTVLQSGFAATGHQGGTILSFLLALPGFTGDYIANQVQTVFYNGDALDDLAIDLAGKTATIALGSAMPGLAGAIMKKGSICGALRKPRAILGVDNSGEPVAVRVKLFNTVARERGPRLLSEGIVIDARDLVFFLELRPRLLSALQDIHFKGKPIDQAELLAALADHEHILIKATN
jgi:hypothetical protein